MRSWPIFYSFSKSHAPQRLRKICEKQRADLAGSQGPSAHHMFLSLSTTDYCSKPIYKEQLARHKRETSCTQQSMMHSERKQHSCHCGPAHDGDVRSGCLLQNWRTSSTGDDSKCLTSIMVPASRRQHGTSCSAWLPSRTLWRGMPAPTMACGLLAPL